MKHKSTPSSCSSPALIVLWLDHLPVCKSWRGNVHVPSNSHLCLQQTPDVCFYVPTNSSDDSHFRGMPQLSLSAYFSFAETLHNCCNFSQREGNKTASPLVVLHPHAVDRRLERWLLLGTAQLSDVCLGGSSPFSFRLECQSNS